MSSANNPAPALQLQAVNAQVYSVHLRAGGEQVGYLKLIGGSWKFKAVGHEADGSIVPGGGPLTDRHNLRFASADEALVSAGLGL